MKHARDLTQGSISRHMAALAAPLILGNILQQLYNAVDAWILGRYAGDLEFAAIGIAGSVMNLFLFAIVGICTGISVLFAQFYGAGDMPSFRKEHLHALGFGLLCTAVFGGVGTLCLPWLLRVIRTPQELCAFVTTYLTVILLSLPASFLYNLYGALLRSIGRANAALMALAAAVTVNLGLDILFVARWNWGIAGAAAATALSQALSAVVCIGYLCRVAPELLFRREDVHLDRMLLKKTAHFSFVTGLHQSSLYIGKLLVQGAVNTGGTDVISAYTATTRIEGFANSFGDSGAAATSVLTAQNRGAKREDRVNRTFRVSLLTMLGMGLLSSLVLYFCSGAASCFMLGSGEGTAYLQARQYLRTIALFYTLCFTGNTYAGYYDGIGRVSIPFFGAVSHITLRVILSWCLVGRMGLNAVAVATGIGWVLVNLLWTVIYFRIKNRENRSQQKI